MLIVAAICGYYLAGHAMWKLLVERQFAGVHGQELAEAWLLTVALWPLVLAIDTAMFVVNFLLEEW